MISAPAPAASSSGPAEFTWTIPLQVKVSLGAPLAGGATPMATVGTASEPDDGDDDIDTGDSDEFEVEAAPSEYLDRKGYDEKFLGAQAGSIPLPKIVKNADQIVTFDFGGNPKERVLRYEHFSVVMRRDRRLCYYSAVNIDGKQPGKEKRPGWTTDPRIPQNLQILKECYGDAPKFSRGHMTRREDPIWGAKTAAARGNRDSMHVTNAVPQMQTFNAGIWLRLEDYALDHAKEDDMKICVFTGPIFRENDPVMFKVKIPVVFWKVIAFLHDETGKLSATGYTMSQEKFLSGGEFVFGAHETHQRSLAFIEAQTGLSFGRLTAADLFEDSEAATAGPLTHPGQIRFF